MFRGRQVGSVVLPTFDDPATGEATVRAAALAASVPVAEVGVGWGYRNGAVDLRVIGPSRPMTGTRSDPNNNSLLLLARVRGVSVLLVGDAEVEQQHALLAELGPDALRADVLKVAHHGSSYQDPELFDAVDPRVALVSVGADNSYGHPSPPVLRRLADNGARVLRTDLDGDIAVVSTSDGLAVVTEGVGSAIGWRRRRIDSHTAIRLLVLDTRSRTTLPHTDRAARWALPHSGQAATRL